MVTWILTPENGLMVSLHTSLESEYTSSNLSLHIHLSSEIFSGEKEISQRDCLVRLSMIGETGQFITILSLFYSRIIDNVRGEINKRQWIIFDGDVDPEWVENLNSVLDDNKLLTLPNGERLSLPPNVSGVFLCSC